MVLQVQTDGWFHNGTWAKARIIARAKIVSILAGKGAPRDADFLKISTLPEIFSHDTKALYHLTGLDATSEEIDLAANVRIVASSPERENVKGRKKSAGRSGEENRSIGLASEKTVKDYEIATRSRGRSMLQKLGTLDQAEKRYTEDAVSDNELEDGYLDGFLEDDSNDDDVGDDMDQGEA